MAGITIRASLLFRALSSGTCLIGSLITACVTGELDPERIGSGIQFGDMKHLHGSGRRQPDCACKV